MVNPEGQFAQSQVRQARPTKTDSRAERVAERIEQDMLDTRPGAGQRIALRTELIAQYGVSANVMNEALHILRERGLVTVKRGANGGIFVNALPPQLRIGTVDVWFAGIADARDLFDAKASIEDLLAECALRRATPEDIKMMSWALDELHGSRDDAQLFYSAILRFHVSIARTARIPYITDLYASICALLLNSIVRATFIADHVAGVDRSLVTHGRLLEAIRTSNIKMLQAACRTHAQEELRETFTSDLQEDSA